MPEFLKLVSVSKALATFLNALPNERPPNTVRIRTDNSTGRILAERISAPLSLPSFTRSTVDGYAVRAADTFGASPALPAYLELVGEIKMGSQAETEVSPGQALIIHTGGNLPESTDSVVMIEDTQRTLETQIEILKPVAPGENVLQKGEDVQQGDELLRPGTELRPYEIGGLMAMGIVEIVVAKRPSVGIISTGDEVIPPEDDPSPGEVRDINSYSLGALVSMSGANPVRHGIIPDDVEALRQAARRAKAEEDMVIITAGSSVSAHDRTAEVIESLGEPGILAHGIAIKPGKPTILAVADGVPVVGLPGNPVSALVVAKLFVAPMIRKMLGAIEDQPTPQIKANLSTNLSSKAGRDDYIPVRLIREGEEWVAQPIFGRSNLIFTLVRSGGLIHIPSEVTGLVSGAEVIVDLI